MALPIDSTPAILSIYGSLRYSVGHTLYCMGFYRTALAWGPVGARLGFLILPPTVYGTLAPPSMLPRACGAMDNASAYGAEDSRFESWQARTRFLNWSKFRL